MAKLTVPLVTPQPQTTERTQIILKDSLEDEEGRAGIRSLNSGNICDDSTIATVDCNKEVCDTATLVAKNMQVQQNTTTKFATIHCIDNSKFALWNLDELLWLFSNKFLHASKRSNASKFATVHCIDNSKFEIECTRGESSPNFSSPSPSMVFFWQNKTF